jgi:cell division protein FtsI (penicillin-binding protein 3)
MAMCVFGIMIIYKGGVIHFKEGKELKSMADSLHTKLEVLQPERGNIFSEDGRLLSSSIPQFAIHIDFKALSKDTFNKYITSMSSEVAKILQDKSPEEYKTIFKQEFAAKNQYCELVKKADYTQYLAIKKIQPFAKGANKGGFIVSSNTKRINPFGMLANRVVGLWRENAQNIGIERTYNKQLSGEQGRRVVRKIAGGTWMPIDGSEIDPENGRDVVSTIDVNIQDVAENALLNQLQKEQAQFGTCIVMEVKTGKIKAMANLGRQASGAYQEDYNYALQLLEPGSTFKLTSLISLFNDNLIHINDNINCQGGVAKFGSQTIEDSHHGLGMLTIKNAFAQSSNVAFAKLIYNNYVNNTAMYWANLHRLHLDTLTGIDLVGDKKARYEKDTSRKLYTLPYMGMGYMAMITPLHTCMVYNTVANGGDMMKPYLVNSIQEYGSDVIKYGPTILEKNAIRKEALPEIIEAMNEVIVTGTGKALKNDDYEICGKTGTAQVADKGIKYSDKVYHGSFVGFFPKNNPQYTICVVLRTKRGSSNYYGGLIALPVFKEVADRLYAMKVKKIDTVQIAENNTLVFNSMQSNDYKILQRALLSQKVNMKKDIWMSNISKDSTGKIYFKTNTIAKQIVPDVNGMGLKDAMYLLEKMGLKVIPVGRGKVKTQSIEAGSAFNKGQYITIQLG